MAIPDPKAVNALGSGVGVGVAVGVAVGVGVASLQTGQAMFAPLAHKLSH